MDTARTPAFEAYVAPARRRPQLWRLIVGLFVALLIYGASVMGLLTVLWMTLETRQAQFQIVALIEAADPASTLLLLASFAGMALGIVAATALMHRRGPGSLFGPRAKVLRHFGLSAAVAVVVYGTAMLGWSLFFDATPNVSLGLWIVLLPVALAGLALQTGAEEMVFRGYLQQQLAARFRSPVAWLLVPSLLFGAVHYDPTRTGDNALLVVAATAAFALAAGDLTARTGSLGAAWGLHFANNVYAILVIATEGTLEGLALYVTPYAADDTGTLRLTMLGDLTILFLTWALLRRMLR